MTIQSTFRAALLDADHPVPNGLLDGHGNGAGKRFNVYRNNVAVSLTEALEQGFPVLRKLLGDQNFRQLAGLYLRRNPPTSPLMMHYGEGMPAFLDGFSPLAHLPYLREVAALELALRRSYHAADVTPIEPDILGQFAPEDLMRVRFDIAPAVQVIPSAYPIYDIWAYNMIDGAPKPAPVAQDVLITRPEFDPVPHAMAPGGAAFVTALREGQTLGAAFHATPDDFDLSPVLGLLLSGAAIAHVSLEDTE